MTGRPDFSPNWVSPPGDTVADVLAERGVQIEKFASEMGTTIEAANDLIAGRTPLTLGLASRLSTVIGSTASFWMVRESQYRKDLMRLAKGKAEEESNWISELPVRDMVRFGWISSTSHNKLSACLDFFGVTDVSTWYEAYKPLLERVAYKTSASFESSLVAVAAWLRRGYLEAEKIACEKWDHAKFKSELDELRSLTKKKDPKDFIPQLREKCAECGVAVVVVKAPSGCRASGATIFVSPTKALLMLSSRHLSEDHFWFSFFHEAGHLLLHGKKELFLEGEKAVSRKEEAEADAFAAKVLIPPAMASEFNDLRADVYQIARFARRAGISPGVVIGQLQHAGRLRPHQFNGMKRRFRWDASGSSLEMA